MTSTDAAIPPLLPDIESTSASKIQSWYSAVHCLRLIRRHGIAYFDRSLTTNDTDFFSTDAVKDISGVMFFSYCDEDKHVYGFDIRSIYTLIQRARISGETPLNPFTRASIPGPIIRKVLSLTKWLDEKHFPTEWAPLAPPTPEQQWRMKVVDFI